MSDRPSRPMPLRELATRWVDRRGHPESPERSMDPRPERSVADAAALVDSAIYVDGGRLRSPETLADTYRMFRDEPGSMAWIGLYRPSEEQLLSLARQFALHELAVEDAIVAHQRPKLERYGDTLFVVLRPARYLDDAEEVDFGELHVFVGRDFVLTVRHSETPDLAVVRRRMESDPGLLARGPEAVLYAILDAVVDGYAPVVKQACRAAPMSCRVRSWSFSGLRGRCCVSWMLWWPALRSTA